MKKTSIIFYLLVIIINTVVAQDRNHSLTYSKTDSLMKIEMDEEKFWKRMKSDSIKFSKSKPTFAKNNLSGVTSANSLTIKKGLAKTNHTPFLWGIAFGIAILLLAYFTKRKKNEKKRN
ncbi:hypothetical protein TMFC_70048 [Tenacibaculum maritimum]|uniref:LPXTG cell wall anchor domain-containing protein n=1 Tax=Tenacibaculum maritimum TaxID=107401 RepID=UPI0012E44EF2|nr:LPXTG cell wall anchor domain-containing protein [Tenacibaculum maritimum]CAA0252429.1 hypothetical protein TMFC_70048 [Tenacibaculum maritimum]